jgi:uncharacterized protein YbjQ (UPF0145 family)
MGAHLRSKGYSYIFQMFDGGVCMLVVTTENIQGYKVVEVKGPVFGLIVRSRGLGADIMASLKGLVGGEIKQYTVMLEDSRKEAMDRMIKNANAMGANAVVMTRFDSGEAGKNMSEIFAYGTAVVVEKM